MAKPNISVGFKISALTFLILIISIELVLGYFYPFTKNFWSIQLAPKVGFTLIPGSEVWITNFFDFATIERANSYGFLDREPEITFTDDETRIVILGDSAVEAAQVKNNEKFSFLLEQKLISLNKRRRYKVLSFGFSGTGTANTIPFYTEIARRFKPQLVILVFNGNDFANNSPILESVRNGWHPYHPPRPFYDVSGRSIKKIDVDLSWQEHRIGASDMRVPTMAVNSALDWSLLYVWASNRLFHETRYAEMREIYAKRIEYLRNLNSEFRIKLAGWSYPEDLDFDEMFSAQKMPLVFEEALKLTAHSVQVLKKETAQDGAKLVMFATEYLQAGEDRSLYGRTLKHSLPFARLKKIADDLEVPLYNFSRYLSEGNFQFDQLHFSHDGHWSRYGHEIAAEGMYDFIKNHI
ncbi:MAG: SGNH/GDSL hydrolase family protein [Deltaproteobacteria bacterium]|nr:SGNH/GDSL hydrolase family protein [Deltaproteobacteria bacterium]